MFLVLFQPLKLILIPQNIQNLQRVHFLSSESKKISAPEAFQGQLEKLPVINRWKCEVAVLKDHRRTIQDDMKKNKVPLSTKEKGKQSHKNHIFHDNNSITITQTDIRSSNSLSRKTIINISQE